MTRTDQTLRVVRTVMSDGRTLEAKLVRDPDGQPVDLIVSTDFSDGHGWRCQAGVLALPPSALGVLRQALADLEGV